MKQNEIDRGERWMCVPMLNFTDAAAEMNNRLAFIDFVRGLLNINPLERWSPQQAKLHPFITQGKFTGQFVPPMNLKSSVNKSPAPGVQQQQQAEALSKQRAQAAQAAQAQAQSAAQTAYANMQMNQYPASPHTQPPPVYNNMYAPHQQSSLPPYQAQPTGYGHQMPIMHAAPPPQINAPYNQQQNLYAQAATRAGRQRASTMDQQHGGIPAAIQRVASHLDPNAPIRLQPSPAYYPPPPEGIPDGSPASARRRASRNAAGGANNRNRNFVQSLEDRTLEEGFMNQAQWH